MTRGPQKEQERKILNAYLSAIGVDPNESDVREQESPDFIIRYRNEVIGIELLGYEQKGTDQSVGQTWEKLRDLAFKSENLPENKCFKFYFWKKFVPKSLLHQPFVEEVERFWSDHPYDAEDFATEHLSNQNFPLLQKYVSKISVSTVGFKAAWQWNYSALWIGVREDELISSIEKKKKKFVSQVDRKWLLLHQTDAVETWMNDFSVEALGLMTRLEAALRASELHRFIILSGKPVQWDQTRGWELITRVA